ncbi:MAG TPA: hypothetical protein VKB85_00400 [Propionibacteriaceae bacterium]|nr:hypothetical protein [Propionibacteriaceae bacterium]
MTAEFTLGAEEELHLIDLATSKLSAWAPQLLSRIAPRNYAAEIQRTTVETSTEAVGSLAGLREELIRLRRGIVDVSPRNPSASRRWAPLPCRRSRTSS